MKIQTIIQVSIVLTLSYTQCMELTQLKTNTNINQTTLIVDHPLINKLIETSEKNKSNPLFFSQRTKRLNILQQLLNTNTNIIFSNNNNEISFWLNQDETIIRNILHEKLLSFLSYRTNENKIKINHTPLGQHKPFSATLQYSSSILYITNQQPLPYSAQKTIKLFLRGYKPNPAIKTIIKNLQEKTPQPEQHPDQSIVYNQETTTVEDLLIQLTNDEHDLFVALPYNTQEFLAYIILEHNDSIKL